MDQSQGSRKNGPQGGDVRGYDDITQGMGGARRPRGFSVMAFPVTGKNVYDLVLQYLGSDMLSDTQSPRGYGKIRGTEHTDVMVRAADFHIRLQVPYAASRKPGVHSWKEHPLECRDGCASHRIR